MTSTGEIPSGALGLHWVFEAGNGQSPPGANYGDGVEKRSLLTGLATGTARIFASRK
jgi:hypothetical protein